MKRTWPNATIPYIISDEYGNFTSFLLTVLYIFPLHNSKLLTHLDEKQGEEIKIAMDAFEAKTCIRFIQRKNHKQYIHIVKSDRNM